MKLAGLHHITMITGEGQPDGRRLLLDLPGMWLVKKACQRLANCDVSRYTAEAR